jgi:hypothetical protein
MMNEKNCAELCRQMQKETKDYGSAYVRSVNSSKLTHYAPRGGESWGDCLIRGKGFPHHGHIDGDMIVCCCCNGRLNWVKIEANDESGFVV